LKVVFHELEVSSKKRFELIDITYEVERIVRESGVREGICLVYAPHATAAVVANEHEAGLVQDIIEKVRELVPPGAGYLHDRIDDNAHAHIASAIIGSARTFPVRDGRLVRGTWQNIFLLEMDGPRSRRRILVEVLGA